jgi:hypothetical protein
MKNSCKPQLKAHKRVHYFEEVTNFRPEDAVYEIISKVKSPRGHTLKRKKRRGEEAKQKLRASRL